MSRVCDICGKRPVQGNRISHADNKTKRLWMPNLQKIRILIEGQKVRANVCTKCIRSGKITKAI
ncbi:MAG: 50S ribosomal protein L28 [Candidatus Coatesbacteria bacterium]|nr:50S ribosomal protein L28 [Candidatus Coatesbacteria bacterium]